MSGRPPAEQAELIGQRLVDAAWAVLIETGPEQFSLDRVAQAARASKQTIYARFSGKHELLQAVLTVRLDSLSAEFQVLDLSSGVATAFADFAARTLQSLSAPEALMLDRLVDWIDTALTGGADWPTRKAIYAQMHRFIEGHLRMAVDQAGADIADIESAAGFWLDGIIGHIRGRPEFGQHAEAWSKTFARFFLRAVASGG